MERAVKRGQLSHPDGKRHGPDKRNASAPPSEPSFFSSPKRVAAALQTHAVTPDSFRGPPRGEEKGSSLKPRSAARWPRENRDLCESRCAHPGIAPRRRPGAQLGEGWW